MNPLSIAFLRKIFQTTFKITKIINRAHLKSMYYKNLTDKNLSKTFHYFMFMEDFRIFAKKRIIQI